ncbi:MAG: methyltransferase domain-containing protein [bacterium]
MTDARAALGLLTGITSPREIDDDILELSPGTPRAAHYDRIAFGYDALLGATSYNRILWKTSPQRCRAFAHDVFHARTSGTHVELGCGSLLFTSHLYAEDRGRPIVLIDQSIEMLRRARRRVRSRAGAVPSHVVLARGDVRDLRVTHAGATTVLAMHVLHVVDDASALLAALASFARPTGSTIGLSSIFLAGGRGDVFLRMLHAAGELATPRARHEIERLVGARVPGRMNVDVEGSMAFVTVGRDT